MIDNFLMKGYTRLMKKISRNIIVFITSFAAVYNYFKKTSYQHAINRLKAEKEKFELYYNSSMDIMMNERPEYIRRELSHMGLKNIAIYGAGRFGKLLQVCLEGSGIEIKYCIDTNAENVDMGNLYVYYPEEDLPIVDAIVVTPFYYFEEIKANLMKSVNYRIINLSSLIDNKEK